MAYTSERGETISSKNSNFPSNKHSRTFPISPGNFFGSDALAGTKFKYLPVYVFISVFVVVHLLWLRCGQVKRERIFIKSAQFYRKFHSKGTHTRKVKTAISLVRMSRGTSNAASHIPRTYRTKFNTARQNFEASYIILLVLLR